MNQLPMQAIRSVLSPSALTSDVLSQYDIGKPVACHFIRGGLNDTYEVLTTSDRHILRVYRAGWRTLDHIMYELDALQHLQQRGVPVSSPIACRNGAYVQHVLAPEGLRYAALFTYAPGTPPRLDEEVARRYGVAAAMIHNATDNFRSPHDRFTIDLEHLIDMPLKSVLPFLSHRPDDQAYLQRLAARLYKGVVELPLDQLEIGFCHGDFHGGNIHISDDKLITVFDFDCGGPGWRAYDIAVFRWTARLQWKEDLLWPAFLLGYQAHRSVADLDLQATSWFVTIRHLWMLGSHTDIAPHRGRGWLDDPYWDRGLEILRGCEADYFDVKPDSMAAAPDSDAE